VVANVKLWSKFNYISTPRKVCKRIKGLDIIYLIDPDYDDKNYKHIIYL
jgi:hypothetical protein